MMAGQSNDKQLQPKILSNAIFQALNSYDFINTFPGMEPGTTTKVSDEQLNVDRLKTRIDRFVEEHFDIVLSIKDYFYNEMTIYGIKRATKIKFKTADKVRMEKLFNRFFIEHENDVRLICNYFFEELKPFLVKNEYLNFPLQFDGINSFVNRTSTGALIIFLKSKGAELITAKLYPAKLMSDQNENQAPSETNFIPLIVYVLILFYLLGWHFLFTVFYSFVALLLVIFAVFIHMRSQ